MSDVCGTFVASRAKLAFKALALSTCTHGVMDVASLLAAQVWIQDAGKDGIVAPEPGKVDKTASHVLGKWQQAEGLFTLHALHAASHTWLSCGFLCIIIRGVVFLLVRLARGSVLPACGTAQCLFRRRRR